MAVCGLPSMSLIIKVFFMITGIICCMITAFGFDHYVSVQFKNRSDEQRNFIMQIRRGSVAIIICMWFIKNFRGLMIV